MQRRTTMRRSTVAALAAATVAALAVPALAADLGSDRTEEARAAIQDGQARNVILFLGDGMGDSEITVARNYALGAAGVLNMDTLPLTGEYTTYSVREDAPTKPDYVTDSAAAGTGWATGTKSYNGAISVDPATKEALPTILEQAHVAGYATGDVTTARLTDATPAVLASHINDRGCEGPKDLAGTCDDFLKTNGGPGSIAEQQVQTGVDVLFGGGRDKFAQRIPSGEFAGKTVVQQAKRSGYQLITGTSDFARTRPGKKVLGLFGPETLPTRMTGPTASPYVPGSNSNNPGVCTKNPELPDSQPSVEQMTSQAIDLLDGRQADSEQGFFLQVEGASIDKQDHAANPCAQIGETVDFDNAVGVGQAYAAEHPDTLVIVTADHGHTSQITYTDQSDSNHSPGNIATLTTADGEPMTINYATNVFGKSQTHTGTQVRIAAQGPQAANVLGITDQTNLYDTMSRALGLDGTDSDKHGGKP